ncbi:MAG: hypothetical protein ACRD29_03155 [Acidimicrobiales bacterium]
MAATTRTWTQLELPLPERDAARAGAVAPRSPLGTFDCCPLCGGDLHPEHAHYRCACGWRDSCCD